MAEDQRSDDDDSELNHILAEYYRRIDAGEAIDKDQFIAEHPDQADALIEFLSGEARLQSDPGGPAPHNTPTILVDRRNTAATPPPVISYFGDYELLNEIARGGMGVVYKARQASLNRIVAIKMILSGEMARESDVQRFHTEAEAAAKLKHPGIVQIYEIGEENNQHYFSMEFVDGANLGEMVRDYPLPAREAAQLVLNVAEAIEYAHEQGVLHRDLKPSNVLLDSRGEVKVTDFGLAKQLDSDQHLTQTGQILGTPSYMPPEQASGNDALMGPTADVYSLGAVLYHLVTQRPPFAAATPLETIHQVINHEPVSPRLLEKNLPKDVETICQKCLQKEPHRRYLRASELAEDLQRFLDNRPILARPISRVERVWRWCHRNPVVAGLSAAVTLLLLALGIAGPITAYKQMSLVREKSALLTRATNSANVAQRKTQEAQKERRAAVSAEREAVASREKTEATLARSNFLLAQARWDNNRVADARELLHRVPRQHRNFEWYLSRRQFEGSDVTLYGHTGDVTSVSFSPDGMRIASSGSARRRFPGSGEIKLWDASTGKELHTLNGHTDNVNSVRFSPDGTRIASGSCDDTIRLWDASTGEELHTLDGHTDDVTSVSFSPDGTRIASGSTDQTIKLWDASTGKEIHTLNGHTRDVRSVSFGPDGTRIASGSWDQTIRLWDASTGEELHTLKGHTNWVTSVSFSPDGTRIASGSSDQTIRLWDASKGEELYTLKGHTDNVRSVSFSPDGTRIASGSDDQTIRFWDAATGEGTPHAQGTYEGCPQREFQPGWHAHRIRK